MTNLPLNRDYGAALLTGYALTGVSTLIQLVLVPLYLYYLGKERFSVLAIIMAAKLCRHDITWLSGSMARVVAERAATGDRNGFAEACVFFKLVYGVLCPHHACGVLGDRVLAAG